MPNFLAAVIGAATALTGESGAPSRTNDKQGATIRIVDLISAGPIVGLASDEDANSSIYINGLPLIGRDGKYNYNGVKWTLLVGEESQIAPAGFGTVESTHGVNREVEKGEPVTIRVRGRGVDAMRLSLRFPALFEQKDDGSTVGSSAQLQFAAKVSSASEYTPVGIAFVSRKSTSPFERNYKISFEPLRAHDPLGAVDEDIDVRVSRLDDKSTDLKINNDSFFASYVSLTEAPIGYHSSAVVALEIDSGEIGNNPTNRTYDIIGLKMAIPDNYIPHSHSYLRAVWGGQFRENLAWTNNPAWILYDLLTNTRYGLGIDPSKIDKFSFYNAGRYNDERVGNGRGGTEPRFTFNAIINSPRSAYDQLNVLCTSFLSRLLWAGGKVVLVQDRPQAISGMVTPANVVDGAFRYTGSALSSRHSAVKVNWVNPNDGWKPNAEIVENNRQIQRSGWKQLDLPGYGITSRAQARRMGLWVLQTELNETEVVSYEAGLDQIGYAPGDVIAVADKVLNDEYDGGRIITADDTPNRFKQISFDKAPPVLQQGKIVWIATNTPGSPFQYVRLGRFNTEENSWDVRGVLPTRVATFASPTGEIIRFDDISTLAWRRTTFAFTSGAIWGIFDPTERTMPKLWRIVSIEETTPGRVEVSALEYYPDKFALVDALAADFSDTDDTDFQVAPPSTVPVDSETITLEPYAYRVKDVAQQSATLSWEPASDARINYYVAEFSATKVTRLGGTFEGQGAFIYDWEPISTTPGNSVIITNFESNPYYIRIGWVDEQGRRGPWSAIKEFEPAIFEFDNIDIQNFDLVKREDGLLLFTWDAIPSLLFSHYQIRHSIDDNGWARANIVRGADRLTATNFSTNTEVGFFYIHAFDVADGESAITAKIQNKITGISGLNIVAQYFRPESAAGRSDTDNIRRLRERGAQAIQSRGTVISDWKNTASRLHRDDLLSYVNRPTTPRRRANGNFFDGSTDAETGLAVRDWTESWYPRVSRAGRVYAFDENGTTEGTDREQLADQLEATNGSVVKGVLYSESVARLSNWASLDFSDSIAVHKDDYGVDGYPVSGSESLESRKVGEDNFIGLEVRRSIQFKVPGDADNPNYTGGSEGLFLKDSLYKVGLNPDLDANPALRTRPGYAPGLLVSKNTRFFSLREEWQRKLNSEAGFEFAGEGSDIKPFGDRTFRATQWYETSDNLETIGNKGFNKTTRIWFPIIDFGAPTEFTFSSEVNWRSELGDKVTDYENRIPDRIDFTNTDNTFNAALPRGGSGGSQIQIINGLELSQSPNVNSSNNNHLALQQIRNDSATLTMEMRYINTADKVEFLESEFSAIPPTTDLFNRSIRTGINDVSGDRTPTTDEISLRTSVEPNLFTSAGTREATAVWASLVIRRPTGIYTNDCSLYRDEIRSIVLRFDVRNRTDELTGIAYDPLSSDTTFSGGWLRIDYAPAFTKRPALTVNPTLGTPETRNQSNTGFEARIVDSDGDPVAGEFNYIALGSGYEITTDIERLRPTGTN